LVVFLTNIQKPKISLKEMKTVAQKISKILELVYCVLNLVKQTRPGEQDFGLFDIYFGIAVLFFRTQDIFFTNSRFEKSWNNFQ